MGAEGGLVDVSPTHPHLVVPGPQVQLGEVARPVKLVQELVDDWDGEGDLDGESVECSVVNTEPLGAVRLLDEENMRRKC